MSNSIDTVKLLNKYIKNQYDGILEMQEYSEILSKELDKAIKYKYEDFYINDIKNKLDRNNAYLQIRVRLLCELVMIFSSIDSNNFNELIIKIDSLLEEFDNYGW